MTRTRQLVFSALFAALLCAASIITLPLGAVPLSLSMLAVFVIGALLEPKFAALSCLVYLLIGAVGVPVFAGMRGGVQVILGPTGGFLMAYPLAALVVALVVRMTGKRGYLQLLSGMTAGLAICYALGTAWYCLTCSVAVTDALRLCVLPFILPDAVKAVAAAAVARAAGRASTRVNN